MPNKRVLHAADVLKAALIDYCFEVRMSAPELNDQVDLLQRSLLLQESSISEALLLQKNPPHSARGVEDEHIPIVP